MFNERHSGRRASKQAVLCQWLGALLVWACLAPPATASCLQSADPEIQRLQDRVGENATDALNQAKSLLAAGGSKSVSRSAALYAVEAEAYGILELDSDARAAAAKGLALAPGAHDPVHLELLSAYAENVYDKAGLTSAIEALDAARMLETSGSPADTCLLISRGLLEHRQDRADRAIVTLTQAYRASIAPAVTAAHIMSADYLSLVLRSMGDYAQALALNQEKIDWDTSHGAATSLSVSRFMRGQILKLMGNYNGAIEEFEQSRKLSLSLGDAQGVAFTDQRICESHIELGMLEPAERECASALHSFGLTDSSDELKETESLQARIELGLGHPESALAILNKVLDRNGADLPPRRVGSMYEWRARTNAALHNYRDAYGDLQEYLQRYTAANDAERTRQALAQRARFETDREIERNAALQRELALSQEQSQRQAQRLRWNAVVVVVGFLVITLLFYFLMTNLRYKKQLVTLASTDSLTGLPNRRRTAELAAEALEAAAAAHQPLTLAIIDMDHFKVINDCCGHATGDHVLQEFARTGRETLRATDILGRWGGEEFLLVMPNTPVELALASLDRLRTLVIGIRLPPSGEGIHVSLSAGLATNEDGAKSLDELVARADAALYTAKNEGRDLVRVAEDEYATSSTGTRRVLGLTV